MNVRSKNRWQAVFPVQLIIAVCMMTAAVVCADQGGSVIVFPKDRTMAGGTVSVVLDPDQDRLPGKFFQVAVGRERGPMINTESMPHAVSGILLEPGENRIVVTFFRQGLSGRMKEVASKEVTVFSEQAVNFSPLVPQGFRRDSYHGKENTVACLRCHGTGPGEVKGKLAAAPGNTCVSCHSLVAAQQYVHGPVAVGSCTACHEAGGGQATIVPAAFKQGGIGKGQMELCGQCHQKTISQTFTHGPVAAGLCTICHDPHTSPYPARLRQPVNDLCKGCHARQVLSTCAAKAPVSAGSPVVCTVCHDPHGSGNHNLLLVKAIIR